MRKILLVLTSLATPMMADTLYLEAPVKSVTAHPTGATVTRKADFSLPAGAHQIVLSNLPSSLDVENLRIKVDGAKKTAVVYRNDRVLPLEKSDSEAVAAAKANIETLEADVLQLEQRRQDVMMRAKAAQAKLAYIERLDAASSAETIQETIALITYEALTAQQESAAAEREALKFDQPLIEARQALDLAKKRLIAIEPLDKGDAISVAVSVITDKATEGSVSLTHLTAESYWTPAYDFFLQRDGQRATLRIERQALLGQYSDDDWQDVDLKLTTNAPSQRTHPFNLSTWGYDLESKEDRIARQRAINEIHAPMAEPVIIAEEAGSTIQGLDGISVTYDFPEKVSLLSDAEVLSLPLGAIELDAKVFALAIPETEETAFVMANFRNDSGELLLPSEYSTLYLDGELIGKSATETIVSGQEVELSFGPLHGLILENYTLEDLAGDSGVLSSRNERSETKEFQLTNLTGVDWHVRILGKTVYSRHEDLMISYTASPQPTEENFNNLRGILMWRQNIDAGQIRNIQITTTMQWPSDMFLK